MGHRTRQLSLLQNSSIHRFSHGGSLRQRRLGRGARPLSSKETLHVVYKVNRERLPAGFRHPRTAPLIHRIFRRYARRFYVKIEQLSLQGDHIHILIRARRRSDFQAFFRVTAGQIAQRVTDTPTIRSRQAGKTEGSTGLIQRFWRFRPFSRVVRGYRAYLVVRDYIQLNEMEASGRIPYQKKRLRDLLPEQIRRLWRRDEL